MTGLRLCLPRALPLLALIAMGCGSNGGSGPKLHLDAGPGDGPGMMGNPDLVGTTTMCQPSGPGSCIAVYNCYFKMQCADQACIDSCNATAKTPSYGSDASNFLTCVSNAFGSMTMPGPCYSICNSSTSDAGVDMCRFCLRGMCSYDMTCNVSCQGGNCGQQAQTCFNDL